VKVLETGDTLFEEPGDLEFRDEDFRRGSGIIAGLHDGNLENARVCE
jgi:hypothetical protein